MFSEYVHYDMQCKSKKISALLCFLDGFGIAFPVSSY